MKIGIMSQELTGASCVRDVFERIRDLGCQQVQLSFHPFLPPYPGPDSPMGRMPAYIPQEMIEKAAEASRDTGVEVSIMAGTWNMIARDMNDRDDGFLQLERTMQACRVLGCPVINLCTGSKGPHMWCRSPENDTLKAWTDICVSMEKALTLAEHYSVTLGLEVEASNVINTPEKAVRLMGEMKSERLKIILDGANLFRPGECRRENASRVLGHAFELLGESIAAVHGKDVKEGDDLDFTWFGNGIVDFDLMLSLLRDLGYEGGILLHGAHSEAEIPRAVENLRRKLADARM